MRVAKERRLKRKARLARKAARDETRIERFEFRRVEWENFMEWAQAQARLGDPLEEDY